MTGGKVTKGRNGQWPPALAGGGAGVIPSDMADIILERLPDTFVSIDGNGFIQWISENCERLFGYSASQFIGRDASIFYADPSIRPRVLSDILAGAGSSVRIEFLSRRSDGSEIWVVGYGCAILNADGTLGGVRGVLRDISETKRMRLTLEESEDRFRRLSDVSTEGICIHVQGRIVDCNKAFADLFGYVQADFDNIVAWDVIHPDDVALAREMVRLQHQKPYEVRGIRKDGSVFPMEIHSKETSLKGIPVRVTCIRDVSEQKKAQEQLRLLSLAVENSPVGVAVVDLFGLVGYANPSHRIIVGEDSAALQRNVRDLYPGQAAHKFAEMWAKLTDNQDWEGDVPVSTGGRVQWQRVSASPVENEGQRVAHYLIMVEDITLRKEQERRILHQAMYDGLTDLPNRTLALDMLSSAMDCARDENGKVALFFVDLDEFKTINDSLGHEYGDELLVLAAERLSKAAGETAGVARFGGDEFLVILPVDSDASAAECLAQRIVDAMAEPFAISRRDLITTASVGLAFYPDDARTAQTLLRNADIAMYQAKLAGRNRYCFFTQRMNQEAENRLRMEAQLRRAVGTDQLFLHYQPLVDVATGRIAGVEALLRWDNPELGSIPPDRFIPQAETCGLIVPIGRNVLEQACRDAGLWLKSGHEDLRLCVNVSPRQFQDPGFFDDVVDILKRTGFPAANLELEVTEGLLLKERGEVESVLMALHQKGVCLAIDDFGTGYSSLSYLERYPFHTLKIDKSFMTGMLERRERRVLVDTIAAMARGLGLKVIAEGVETLEQFARLKAIGCDLAQGFLFSKPVSAEKFSQLLAQSGFSLEKMPDDEAPKVVH